MSGSLSVPLPLSSWGRRQTSVPPCLPAVEREAVLPNADVQLTRANEIGRHLVRQDHSCGRLHIYNEAVRTVKQGTARWVDASRYEETSFVTSPPGSVGAAEGSAG